MALSLVLFSAFDSRVHVGLHSGGQGPELLRGGGNRRQLEDSIQSPSVQGLPVFRDLRNASTRSRTRGTHEPFALERVLWRQMTWYGSQRDAPSVLHDSRCQFGGGGGQGSRAQDNFSSYAARGAAATGDEEAGVSTDPDADPLQAITVRLSGVLRDIKTALP